MSRSKKVILSTEIIKETEGLIKILNSNLNFLKKLEVETEDENTEYKVALMKEIVYSTEYYLYKAKKIQRPI